ncbi:glycosyl transferase family 36 [bacterium BRH_c32]|nr:MAG: glycosyl transferase family 36 [bacterium BRH_c32]
MKQFETKYGYFEKEEYVIKTYKTPKPWVNVVSNGKYGFVVSQTGGGFSWDTHSEFNRLNRWHQDMIQDNWGKYFYIKNNKSGEIWSPTWQPVRKELDKYEARYGTGYVLFLSEYKGIEINIKAFVPFDENLEIWNFTIINNSGEDADLSIYTYFEWCLGSSADHHREFHKQFIETEFSKELNAMTGKKRMWDIPLGERGHWNIEYPYIGFIASDREINDYEGDKESFIGNYGSLNNPEGISRNELSKKTGKWNDSVAVIKIDSKVRMGAKDNFSIFMGIESSKDKISSSLNKFSSQEKVENAFEKVKQNWRELLSDLEVQTPDGALNLLVNQWLRYQAIAGRLWGRTAYYQQSGAFGFRDQLQDSLVYLPIKPEWTAEQIRLHARHQFKDGQVLHWWHPISETGLQTKMTDDLLWLPFVISQYIKETDDYSILEIKEPYYDDKTEDTLLEHCIAAIEKVLTRYSERGLPLIGAGDWNDGLSAVGLDMKGESLWLAQFFYLVLIEFTLLLEEKNELKEKYLSVAAKLKTAVEEHCWDGDWYWRATKDNGEYIGSKNSPEGKIFLNAQTWSVISGIGSEERQLKAMESAEKNLLKDNGALLLAPAYSKPDNYIGYLSRYAPGRRENGGVYTHAATWAIWAFAKLKQQGNTFEAYKRLNPILSGMDPDRYVAEPFVTPGNIDGPDSPKYGMGGWTWYTGSASWYQKVIVDHILGIRASKKGLEIDPCIPKDWNSFSVKRKFRGTLYAITVDNSNHSGQGVRKVIIDGDEVKSKILNVSGKELVQVKVILG